MMTEFIEDYNTATFPSDKYYDLDVRGVGGARARPLSSLSLPD